MANNEKGQPQDITALGYFFDNQSAALRTGLSTVDDFDTNAKVTALHTPFGVLGRPNVSVSARFSAASATCGVTLFYLAKQADGTYFIKGRSAATTITAPSAKFGTSYTPADVVFDSAGATHVIVCLSTAVSSGTVDLAVGSY